MSIPSTASDLVGREHELGLITELLVETRNGAGPALLFSGEPGSGKTSLLDAGRVLGEDLTVLTCRGVAWEAELPFSCLHELLRPLLGNLDVLPEPQRRALEGAFGLGPSGSAQLLNLYAAVLSLLVETTRDRPVLVVADDLQWIDDATGQALSFVSRRIAGEQIGLLIATRPEPHVAGLPEPVSLRPLDEHGVARLANRGLSRPIDGAELRVLTRATAGNPLAVVETVRQFGTRLRGSGSVLDQPIPVGELIERAFSDRLDAVSEPGRRALQLIAASLDGDSMVLLAAAPELGISDDAITEIESAALVRRDGTLLEIEHPVLRALIHQRTSLPDLRRCHGALAVAEQSDAAHRAWYAAAAAPGPDEAIAGPLAEAAEQFMARGGYLAAAQALQRSASLSPGPDERASRLTRAARAAHLGGRGQWAAALVEEACGLARDPRVVLQAELERASVLTHVAEDFASAEAMLALADAAWDIDPSIARRALSSGAVEAVVNGNRALLAAALERYEDPRAESPVERGHPGVGSAKGALLLVTGASGRDAEACEIVRNSVRERLRDQDFGGPDGNDDYIAEMMLWIEDYELCAELCDLAMARARDVGDLIAIGGLRWISGQHQFRFGDWDSALESYAECVRLSGMANMRWQHAVRRTSVASIEVLRGDESFLAVADEVEAVANAYGFRSVVQYVGTVVGLAHLGAGRNLEAVAALERVAIWTRNAGQVDPGLLTWPTDLVEAYLLAGRDEDARALLEELRALAINASARPWRMAAIASLDGMLAPVDDFDACFRRAIELFDGIPAPFDRARAQLAYGQRLRRARRKIDARAQLASAAEEFDRLGAVRWSERARSEMGATAASLRKGSNFDPDALTSQEREVARLVAGGASNKEVAGAMFLSPKTIETHLSRVYRKLGVASRTQLAATLRTD